MFQCFKKIENLKKWNIGTFGTLFYFYKFLTFKFIKVKIFKETQKNVPNVPMFQKN